MRNFGIKVCVLLLSVLPAALGAQQVADSEFRPTIARPSYAEGHGPVVCVDEAHHNFHTLGGRFWAFGELLRRDGYVLRGNTDPFTAASLARCRVLVISNAQPSDAEWNRYPYPTPAAFTDAEIRSVRAWVERGGRLLLIADHMPLAGAAAALAAAFGFAFNDGFAVEGFDGDSARAAAFTKPTMFALTAQTLRDHPVTRGRDSTERVSRVRSFTGQAFQAPVGAEPVMVLPPTFISLMPRIAWQFDSTTRRVPVGGWLQGATLRMGDGRVAVFGEAAMFSAQLGGANRRPMGMNAPGAEQNPQLVRNVIRWLSATSTDR